MGDTGQRLSDVERGARIHFTCDGVRIAAHEGETIAAALLAAGQRTLRATPRAGAPRGLFCAMGICFDCVMVVDGVAGVRTCMAPVRDNMTVTRRLS